MLISVLGGIAQRIGYRFVSLEEQAEKGGKGTAISANRKKLAGNQPSVGECQDVLAIVDCWKAGVHSSQFRQPFVQELD